MPDLSYFDLRNKKIVEHVERREMIEKLEYFRDPNFMFDEGSHSYTYVNPETGLIDQIFESTSGFIDQFKPPFNEDISKYVAKSRGVTQQEVLNEWKEAGIKGKTVGTEVHKWIEDFYNGLDPDLPACPTSLNRVELFKKAHEERLHKLKPIAQELRIFSRKWGIAGTIDIIFEMDGKFYVGDWKTNKDFKDDDHPKGRREKLFSPFDDLWNNNLNGYSLQVSTYRMILEEEAGFKTEGAFLVSLSESGYKLYKALDLIDKLKVEIEKNNFTL
jgi:hypothetical protein